MGRNSLPWRKNTEGYFVDGEGNILAQISDNGFVILPGGGIDEGETPEDSIIRETLEETGAVVAKSLKLLTKLQIIWGPKWAKTDKQKRRYEQFRGDEMYFFWGRLVGFKEPRKGVEDIWKGKKLLSIFQAIEFIEKQRPFPQELKAYRETQLKILHQLKAAGKPFK